MIVEGFAGSRPIDRTQEAHYAEDHEVRRAPLPIDQRVGSIDDFKDKAPDLWEKMVLAIASDISNKMKKNNDRLKAIMREGRQR